ncbi:MAG: response regulator transcription factor [Candidatus Falkowbacteria bacterium]
MKLLIIEDEKEILSFLKTNLASLGFVADGAQTGQIGLTLAEENIYDLIILDLNLPDLNGQKICENLRTKGQMTPILILSANSKLESKIDLLNLGADDYLAKPFSLEELIARIKALLRRPKKINSNFLNAKDIQIDCHKQTVTRNGKEIYLTRKEFLILEYFMNHAGAVISRGEITEHAWDMEANLLSKAIETHILNLRKKIDSGRKQPLIKTISGRGYKFN